MYSLVRPSDLYIRQTGVGECQGHRDGAERKAALQEQGGCLGARLRLGSIKAGAEDLGHWDEAKPRNYLCNGALWTKSTSPSRVAPLGLASGFAYPFQCLLRIVGFTFI